MVQHETGGPLEPVLLLLPTVAAADVAFLFLVVEGKAYSTGKQIFEAENQAAVTLACAHKILICLDRIAGQQQTQIHVLFSVSTQGPVHELWAHWTVLRWSTRIRIEAKGQLEHVHIGSSRELYLEGPQHVRLGYGTGLFMESVVAALRKAAMWSVI